MIELGQEYFATCRNTNEPYLITGLALYLGFCSREALDAYGRRDEYHDVVKRLKAEVAAGYEGRLNGNSPTGAIFALKNMGWSDQQNIKLSGDDEHPLTITVRHVGTED